MAKAVKTKPRVIPKEKVQDNFNIDEKLKERALDLAHHTGTSKAEVYNKAIDHYIKWWETEHNKGKKIPARPKGGLK